MGEMPLAFVTSQRAPRPECQPSTLEGAFRTLGADLRPADSPPPLPARQGLRGDPEQHRHEVQEEGQAGQHGEEQGAGSPLLLPHLAQDLQAHRLRQR